MEKIWKTEKKFVLQKPHEQVTKMQTKLILGFSVANKFHSVLEQIWIKGSYLDQRLLQHESLYPICLKSARIEIPHIGSHYIDFSKTDFY